MDVWESSRAETVTLVTSLEEQVKALEGKRELLEEAFFTKGLSIKTPTSGIEKN
jgi:hypothetical protein